MAPARDLARSGLQSSIGISIASHLTLFGMMPYSWPCLSIRCKSLPGRSKHCRQKTLRKILSGAAWMREVETNIPEYFIDFEFLTTRIQIKIVCILNAFRKIESEQKFMFFNAGRNGGSRRPYPVFESASNGVDHNETEPPPQVGTDEAE